MTAIVKEERIGGQRLILGDCRAMLSELEFDVICSDPPYGIGYVHGAEKSKYASAHNERPIVGDDEPFDPAPWLRWPCLMWGANHFASRLPGCGRWLVWDKRDGVGFNDQSDVEIGWVTGPRAADRIFSHLWSGWTKASERGIPRVHPTQKPVAVMGWSLSFLPKGIVLDPYMGSGTTIIAAHRLGLKSVGVEIDPIFFDAACRRVDEATRQTDMFLAPPPPEPRTKAGNASVIDIHPRTPTTPSPGGDGGDGTFREGMFSRFGVGGKWCRFNGLR